MVFEGKIVSNNMIKDTFQAAAAHLFRVEGLEGACGGVAGVGKGSVPYIRAFLVQGVEGSEGHVDLAPYLEVPGHVPDVGRYGGNGPDILGNVVPHCPVPPREGPYELSPGITEADGRTVELQLALPDPPVEVLQFLYIIGVSQRKHGPAVAELTELPGTRCPAFNVTAYFYGRGVRRCQFRMDLFQRGKLHHHYVVFKICNFRIIEHIVSVIVPLKLLSQELNPHPGILFIHGIHIKCKNIKYLT